MIFSLRLVVALTLCVLSFAAQAQDASVQKPRGPYMIASGSQNMVWRIDQSTGLVSYCIRDTISNDASLIAQRPPLCSAWGY